MIQARTPAKVAPKTRLLTAAEFQHLADVPPEVEWFANIRNPHTKRAYENAIKDFMLFAGIKKPEEFPNVARAHVIAWRDDLGSRTLIGTTIRHRLAALSSLFQYLCDKNAVTHNPVKGVKRPKVESEEGKTPAIADHQARKLLVAPAEKTLKGMRDRAILATLLYHALRREELCKLRVRDFKHERRGVTHLKVSGKGEKTRYVPLHGIAQDLIGEYLKKAGHGGDDAGALFRPFPTAAAPVGREQSLPTASTSWCGSIRRCWDSRLAPTLYGPRRRPMPSITKRTLLRSRNGSVTPTSQQRGSTIIGRRGQRTAQRSR
jgi:integrase